MLKLVTIKVCDMIHAINIILFISYNTNREFSSFNVKLTINA